MGRSSACILRPVPFVRVEATSYSQRCGMAQDKRCYHAMLRGSLVDGILRRVDPQKRGQVQFVADEITGPLGVKDYRLVRW